MLKLLSYGSQLLSSSSQAKTLKLNFSLYSSSFLIGTLFRCAMNRFMSSAASSSSGRAERAAAAGSAEQPHTPSHLKILSIHDVQRWLAQEPIASCSSADAHRIREAGAVLSHRKPTREALQPLLRKWNVAKQKDQKTDR